MSAAGRTEPGRADSGGNDRRERAAIAPAAWAAIAVAASLAAHAGVLDAWFHNDDLLHLYQLANFGSVDFMLAPYGGHLYAVRNAVFAAAHGAFGLWSTGYLALLLANHLLNVTLLFAVLRTFLGPAALAGLGALAWGMMPLHRGVLGWYSAHGIALVASLLLWLLLDLARARSGALVITQRRVLGWMTLLVAGSLCYGVGVALAIFFPLVARLLLPVGALDRRSRTMLLLVAIATPALYIALWTLPTLEGGVRNAGMQLTILYPPAWLYMLRATLTFFGYGLASLVLGPFVAFVASDPLNYAVLAREVAVGPLADTPAQGLAFGLTLLGAAFVLAVALLAWRSRPSERRLLLGFAAVGVLAYGMIAVGRAYWGLMLRIEPEILATTARYQYLGSIAVCLMLCWALLQLGPSGARGRRTLAAALAIWLAILFGASVPMTARVFPADPRARKDYERFEKVVTRAARTGKPGATLYLRNRPFATVDPGPKRPENFPGWAAVWVLSHDGDTIEGRPVRFVEEDSEMVERLRSGRSDRVTKLVVTREECGTCNPL